MQTRYAVISDVHGNLPALQAVIADAERRGANAYLLLGDYIVDFPWPNEVAETLRSLRNATIIRGNKEERLLNARVWRGNEQMAATEWTYRELTPENLTYYSALPSSAEITDDSGEKIRLFHNFKTLIREPRIEIFRSSLFHAQMGMSRFTIEDANLRYREAVLNRSDAMAEIAELPDGVYLWGHNHLQSKLEIDGKLLINPGGCGVPLDFAGAAPYTLIERTAERWKITQLRVKYDVQATVDALKASQFSKAAPVWVKLAEKSLLGGRDYFAPFRNYAHELGLSRGEPDYPVSNETWRLAAATFDWDSL
ncbi:MAG: metallophosphoesterase [Oscillospiraceae bacterium]|jgi:predicted phosphodiesterase|nr:metallophosphoesterase [Oscillospiraceae bacterium]